MRVAIRTPEYFPRCSVMALIDYADEVVLGDTFALSRQSFHARTPVRTPDGRMWLTLPLERTSRGRPVAEVRLVPNAFWPGKHWRALRYNYSGAPFFRYYADELEELLRRPWPSLGALTTATVLRMMQWLRIDTPVRLASEAAFGDGLGDVAAAFPEARIITAQDTRLHDERLVEVHEVVDFAQEPYTQAFPGFEADLSALDLLFNWGSEALPMLRARRRVREVKPA